MPAPRRLPDRLRGRPRRLRGFGAAERPAGLPRPLHGRIDRDPSGPDAAAADPCYGDPDKRSRTGTGQMVQSVAWLRLPDAGGGDAGHFRAYGNAAPVRHDRTAARPVRAGPLRTGAEGHDGRRSPSRRRTARSHLSLITPIARWAAARSIAVALFVTACALAPARAADQATL